MIKRKGRQLNLSRGMTGGSYVDGFWVEPLRATQQIWASVQPIGEKELLILSDGDRNKELKKLYSDFKFQIKDDLNSLTSDIVEIDGKQFECLGVQDYSDHQSQMSIKYYKGIFARINENTNHNPSP